jgi:hypothetical protein
MHGSVLHTIEVWQQSEVAHSQSSPHPIQHPRLEHSASVQHRLGGALLLLCVSFTGCSLNSSPLLLFLLSSTLTTMLACSYEGKRGYNKHEQ